MNSNFLQKLEDEKKLAQAGKPIDKEMNEEDEEDVSEEEKDNIADLSKMQDGVGKMHLQDAAHHKEGGDLNAPVQQHSFHMPKPPSQVTNTSKYDPAPWSDYFDTTDLINGKVPCYYAGTKGHIFLCLHGAGHSAQSFAALA